MIQAYRYKPNEPTQAISPESATVFSAVLGAWLGIRLPGLQNLLDFIMLFAGVGLFLGYFRLSGHIREVMVRLYVLCALGLLTALLGSRGTSIGEQWGLLALLILWIVTEEVLSITRLIRGAQRANWRGR
jgi:hypothetical protein